MDKEFEEGDIVEFWTSDDWHGITICVGSRRFKTIEYYRQGRWRDAHESVEWSITDFDDGSYEYVNHGKRE